MMNIRAHPSSLSSLYHDYSLHYAVALDLSFLGVHRVSEKNIHSSKQF